VAVFDVSGPLLLKAQTSCPARFATTGKLNLPLLPTAGIYRPMKPKSTTEPSSGAKPYALPLWHRAQVPILRGSLRGYRWLPASGGKLLRVLLGTYERRQSKLFAQLVGEGDVVLDVGAAAGYYTLLGAKRVGPSGRVLAFEADRKNVAYLREHAAVNRLKTVSIFETAVGDESGTARFAPGRGTGTGRLARNGARRVSLCRLDDVFTREGVTPTHVKIDVEGAELAVLRGATQILRLVRPILFLSTHGPQHNAACCRLLHSLKYQLTGIDTPYLASASEILAEPAERCESLPTPVYEIPRPMRRRAA